MANSNISGRLLNAERRCLGSAEWLVGDIYEDTRGRFNDGDRVTTSLITLEDGSIFYTQNSIYEVEGWV